MPHPCLPTTRYMPAHNTPVRGDRLWGGVGTKIHAAVNGLGLPVAWALSTHGLRTAVFSKGSEALRGYPGINPEK